MNVDVVYIAGAPRSGSTIVAALLGEVPGVLNAGEVRFVWRQLAEAGTCGCGRELPDCEVWSAALGDAADRGEAARLARANLANSLIRTLPLSAARHRLAGRPPAELRRHVRHTLPLYGALATAGGARVVVDSSKSPSYAYLLATSPGVNVHLLHLVRDPRAIAYSWLRERGGALPRILRLRLVLYHAIKWTAWNLLIETLVRRRAASYVRLVYEDVARAPVTELAPLVASHGLAAERLPLEGRGSRVARLRTNHTVDGNGYRFRVGMVPIRVDDEWRERMSRGERAVVAALAWPLLRRYGFR